MGGGGGIDFWENIGMGKYSDLELILYQFHHIHHDGENHEVHHCFGEHCSEGWKIQHCIHGKHSINVDKVDVISEDFDRKLLTFSFREHCDKNSYHIESAVVKHVKDNDPIIAEEQVINRS